MSLLLRAASRALVAAAPALALPVFSLPSNALAADAASPTTTVDEVIVTARPDREDPPVVAAARRRLSQTPGAVAVVAAEAYRDRYASNLSDALRDVPGVFAQKKWGGDVRLSIRGSGIGNASHNRGTLLAQDGVPFNEADGYGDFQLIDPAIARYTEVWKGGNALRFGGALLGGAVNLVTPTGRTAGGDMLRLDGGSWGTVRGHGEVAGFNDDEDVFAAATALVTDGWRKQSQGREQHLSFNYGRRFGDNREVRLIVSGGNVDQEIPGSLSLDNALHSPTKANPANLANNYQRDMRAVRGALQTRWRIDDSTVFEGGVYGTWKDLWHPIFQVLDQESRNFGAFGRFDWTGQVAGMRADLFWGGWARSGDLDGLQFVNRHGSAGAKTADNRQNAKAYDLFGEGRLFVTDHVALVAGGSWGRAERDFVNNLNHARDASKDYDWFAPRVGVLWEGEGGEQVFANLTRSVEPPNFSALVQSGTATAFVPLKPQEAWTAEAGARGRRGSFTWDVAVYRAELRHELLNFIVDPSIPAATFNAGPTIHQGVEAGLDWRITPTLRLRQTYAFSDFRFDGDRVYGDGKLPVVPEQLYRAELKYEHPSGWFVAPSVEWSPEGVRVDYANTLKAPAYAVWSLNGGWKLNRRVELFAEARNLFDTRYVSNVTAVTDARVAPTAVFYPGDGRAFFAGVTGRF
jgi:iron complex outermembrane receptor protein